MEIGKWEMELSITSSYWVIQWRKWKYLEVAGPVLERHFQVSKWGREENAKENVKLPQFVAKTKKVFHSEEEGKCNKVEEGKCRGRYLNPFPLAPLWSLLRKWLQSATPLLSYLFFRPLWWSLIKNQQGFLYSVDTFLRRGKWAENVRNGEGAAASLFTSCEWLLLPPA